MSSGVIYELKCQRSPLTTFTDFLFEKMGIIRYTIKSTKTLGRVTAISYSRPMMSREKALYVSSSVSLNYSMGWRDEVVEYDRKNHTTTNF